MKSLVKKIDFRELGIFYALVVLWFVLIVVGAPGFRQFSTYQSILQKASFMGICGVGMTLCIASKHFDQSIGSMSAFLGCTFVMLLRAFSDRPPQEQVGVTVRPDGVEYLGITWAGVLAAFLITLALGVLCGLFNGVLVAKLRIPAFIATLGTLYVFRGSAYLVTDSQPYVINQQITTEQYALFNYLGTGTILWLPFSFWVMLLCAAVGGIVLRKMKLGRDTLAIGNSVEASRISGINIDRTKILVFTLLGSFVGISAVLNTCYLASENAGMLQGFEFDVITTVVLGGTALAGGKGNIFNSMSAALFFATLTVGMPLIGISSYPQRIIQGAILLFAFSINEIRAQMESRRVKAGARRAAALKAASQS
ncbi:MAG: ABC transporter permease [Oscillospiraceae bacterium]|jgi:ribose/xylose/arabinose/galactoside ABC-type transport system permease subunit|nr:ABC transporter permease [Oscillospiraceae bacterium]